MLNYEKLSNRPNGQYRVYNCLTNKTITFFFFEEEAKIFLLNALYLYGRENNIVKNT
jgi:hypothetical protein